MINLFGQAFSAPGQSQQLYIYVALTMAAGFALIFALMAAPPKLRRPIVAAATFIAGFYYFMRWLWPAPVELSANEVPRNSTEYVGRWLSDAQPIVSNISQTVAILLLGLGVYSVLRLHLNRLMKKQKDWAFSLVLLISLVTMVTVSYTDYIQKVRNPSLDSPANWTFFQYAQNFLFDGMLQAMDAAMFSVIAFFILFAAYRAFRIRSIESTVLLASALIVMLSLMGGVEYFMSKSVIDGITGGDPGHFMNNLALVELRSWIQQNIQAAGLQALTWGVGIGALSMGLRLWLSLERGGGQ